MASSDGSRALGELLGRVKAGWPAGTWEWDAPFECALTTLKQDAEAQGRATLSANLPGAWTRKTLDKAPALAQQVCAQTGGLRGDQLIFTADLGDIVAYALWWPWGSGSTFSIRIGVASSSAGQNLTPALRSAFGV